MAKREAWSVWRDGSAPAFTAETPHGSHPAWFFADQAGKSYGPYFTRGDAERAMDLLKAA